MKLGAIRALRPQLERLEPDLVHIQTPFIAHYQGTALARALRVPVIESYHTYFEEYLHHYVPLMPRAVMRFIARRFTVSQCNVLDALVVPSRAMEQALVDYGVRCPMHIIPTGMEMERFAGGDGAPLPRTARHRAGATGAGARRAHRAREEHRVPVPHVRAGRAREAGRSIHRRGRRPGVELLQGVRSLARLEQQVRFVGYLARERELLDCYRAGDLFVFSSKTETQGLVLLEAMALGVPVVSTAHMGTADIVNPQRGAHAAPDDEADFASIVVRLLEDPPRRAAMSAEARAYAATWSASAMADRLAGLYCAVVDQASRNSPVSQPV